MCPSPSDSLISLSYSMPVFSANSFGLFLCGFVIQKIQHYFFYSKGQYFFFLFTFMKNESTKPLPLILFVKKTQRGNSFIIHRIRKGKRKRKNQIIFIMRYTELYKRERERLVHWATHERGSLLAHIFPKVLVHEREWTWLTFFAKVHSF